MFQFQPYAQAYFNMESILDINRFYYNQFIADLPKFKVLAFVSSIVNSDFRVCFGGGFENDNIKLSIQMKHTFMNCYKNLIYDICSFDGVWTGRDASIFEKCEKSDQDNSLLEQKYTTWNFLDQATD